MSVVILGPLSEGVSSYRSTHFRCQLGLLLPLSITSRSTCLWTNWPRYGHRMSTAKILGDSMIGAGIFDKDLIVVDRSRTAEHGEIVVAVLNNSEPICKRLFMMDGVSNFNPKIVPTRPSTSRRVTTSSSGA